MLIRNLLFKTLSTSGKRCVLESREHTVFPQLVWTVKTEVLVNDDVTVSDLRRDKDVSLPPCIVKFVFLILTACLKSLNV